jgi:hypothetical protein
MKRRTYQPRIVGGQVMLQADLERLPIGKRQQSSTPFLASLATALERLTA